jgi:hypothetical protein
VFSTSYSHQRLQVQLLGTSRFNFDDAFCLLHSALVFLSFSRCSPFLHFCHFSPVTSSAPPQLHDMLSELDQAEASLKQHLSEPIPGAGQAAASASSKGAAGAGSSEAVAPTAKKPIGAGKGAASGGGVKRGQSLEKKQFKYTGAGKEGAGH